MAVVNRSESICMKQQAVHVYLVEEEKKLWQSLRNPFRKLEMTRCGGAGADKKSGSAGMTLSEKISTWAYYDKMSFLQPYIYSKE